MIETDESLAAQARDGDRSAFEELVRRTGRLVFARLYLLNGNPHEAEDLTQETFLVACRNIRQLSDPKAFRGWLLSIATSVSIDAAKNKSRRKRGKPVSIDGMEMPTDSPGPPESAERDEERRRVLASLRLLPEEYQQALSLRYLSGADHEEIGKQLGITNGSLRGLLHRGLAMLREKMS
jgi:RNA polymerase sigma-70 factor (ECF subfamily)